MDWRKTKTDALAALDTAINIAQRIPDVPENQNSDFSYEKSVNPFPFLIDLIRRFRGYDYMIKLVARFIAYVLPAVELAVKVALIANLKNLLYCTINPLLRKNDVLREGITINLEDIDLLHTLQYCPIKTKTLLGNANQNGGHLFYFGCDGFEFPSQLVNAGDFNAFLWYVINRVDKRVVWRGTSETRNLAQSAEMFGVTPTDSFLYQKELVPRGTESTRDPKGSGILTLIKYSEGETPRDAVGVPINKPMLNVSGNLLHVYIGNTTNTGLDDQTFITLENNYQTSCNAVTQIEAQIAELRKNKSRIEKEIEKKKDENLLTMQMATVKRIEKNIAELEKKLPLAKAKTEDYAKDYNKMKTKQVEHYGESTYRPIETNYYYNKTLMDFNYDYIMSMKLFDSKVVAAQLIENLLNLSSSGHVKISYERKVIVEEVKKMITNVLERGSTTINDCFFAFSNDELNNLQRQAELQRAGLFSGNGEDNTTAIINADIILNNLNNISSNATQEEVQSIIEGTFTEISKELAGESTTRTEDHMNGNVGWNFVKQLMENLLTVIVETICSPKVYLAYLINLKMLGKFDTNFNLEKFIKAKGELITAIVQEISDIWADFLLGIFKELSAEVFKMVKQLIAAEQFEDYKKLLRQCLECFKIARSNDYLDFNLDDVDYADILPDDLVSPEENNC